MIPSDSDRPAPPHPSPNGLDGSEDPAATAAYVYFPVAGPLPGSDVSSQSASHNRFDFLAPRRTEGELGWLAHYRVLRLLGEGNMGLVFRAEDSLLSRPGALKVIRPEIAHSPATTQRFMREARATAAIKHDHIVTIYQVGEENGVPFLAMEYLTGMSLAQWLERGHSPSVELVLRLGREIADGLSAAHRRGLIHRDIKPANIWLEAPSGRVKILDFGMARSRREDVEITHSGTVLGTPSYMAPEQARGEPVGAGSDLFSLGCVLYRLCTGRLPFEGESIMAVLTALSTTTPRRPRDWRSALPPALDELLMRLLVKDPADRPESAEVVVKALRSIERALYDGRRKAELTASTSLPAVVGPTTQAPAEAAPEPGPGHPATNPRRRQHAIAIAAAMALMLAAAAEAVLVLAYPRTRALDTVATKPTPIAALVERAGVPNSLQTDRGLEQTQSAAGSIHLKPQGDPAVLLGKSSAAAPEGPDAPAAVGPGGSPRVRPDSGNPPAPENSSANDRTAPPGRLRGLMTRDDLPAQTTRSEKASAEEPTQASRQKVDWGDFVDPDGDCQLELDQRDGRLRIVTPGKTHILSAEIGYLNAPRLLRDIKGDFDVTVRVAGTSHPGGKPTTTNYPPFHGAGILVWQDEANYVRLEIAADVQHGKPRPYVNFEYRKEGALAVSSGLKNSDGSNYLRLKRRGDEIVASFGPDGLRWTSFSPLSAKLNQRLQVGVAAINSSTKPLTAELEGLQVVEKTAATPDAKPAATNQ
jgi:serine/threonine protein kinase/regulation of enolase protein 1 (concanavalin A-like superfamily)